MNGPEPAYVIEDGVLEMANASPLRRKMRQAKAMKENRRVERYIDYLKSQQRVAV